MTTALHAELSIEAIMHNADPDFFPELTKAIADIRSMVVPVRPQTIKAADFDPILDVIQRHTGLEKISLKLVFGSFAAAAVVPPALDKNHPFYTRVMEKSRSDRDVDRFIKNDGDIFIGDVDLNTGRVSGDFAKIPITYMLNAEVFNNEYFESDEIAAYLLHETGHVITYMIYLGRTVSINHVLGQGIQHLAKVSDARQRIAIAKAIGDRLDISDVFDPTVATKLTDDKFHLYAISNYVEKTPSATDTVLGDARTWEALADQYATRLGAARPLVVVQDKTARRYGVEAKRNYMQHLVVESLRSPVVTLGTLIFWPVAVMMRDMERRYDTPTDRFTRIREDLVSLIKQPKLEREMRRTVQDDIRIIDEIIDQTKHYPSYFRWLMDWTTGPRRSEQRSTKIVQELERLTNNELYVKANDLSLIANQ